VDSARDAWVCGYCGMPFIVEKAIQNFNITQNITADTVNIYTTKDYVIRGGVLAKYNGEAVDAVVPDGVVEIGKEAFKDCAGLRSVVLPNNVEIINEYAFMGCDRLQEIELKPGLKIIKAGAFFGCSALREVMLPEGLKTIEVNAFTGCASLERITIPDSVEKIGAQSYEGMNISAKNIFLKFNQGQWLLETQQYRKEQGLCQHCGNKFSRRGNQACVGCGQVKDY